MQRLLRGSGIPSTALRVTTLTVTIRNDDLRTKNNKLKTEFLN